MEDNGNKGVTDKWWNAALYDHDTGKPYAAFYELKNFTNGSTGIQDIRQETERNKTAWYSLDGRRLGHQPSQTGIYINEGKKKIVR
jgi:arabinogalactan endo-1,4-beta-galactosidase